MRLIFIPVCFFTAYYTHIINGSVVEHATSIVGEQFTAKMCAQSCYTNTDFVCNSFYFCSGNSQCLLSKQNVPNGSKTNIVPGCEAYSSKYSLN